MTFDELLILQIGLNLLTAKGKVKAGCPVKTVNIDDFLYSLPYTPTRAQFNAIKDILLDFKSGYA